MVIQSPFLGLLHCFQVFPILISVAADIMGIFIGANIVGDYIYKSGIIGEIMKLPKHNANAGFLSFTWSF